MIFDRRLMMVVGSLVLAGLALVLLITLRVSFNEQKNSFFRSAQTILEVEALKKAYSEQSKDEKIIQIIEKRALKPMLTYKKSSETIGEYKIDGADPVIGREFLKEIMSKGFKIEGLEIIQRADHRVDIYLKVQF